MSAMPKEPPGNSSSEPRQSRVAEESPLETSPLDTGAAIEEIAREYQDPREAAVLKGIGAGARNPEIATLLDMSEGTVKAHVNRLMQKLGARSRPGLAQLLINAARSVSRESGSRSERHETNQWFDATIEKASELMGNRQEALRWLGTPVRALDFATPVSLLGSPEGARRVEDVLGQMEHGVW